MGSRYLYALSDDWVRVLSEAKLPSDTLVALVSPSATLESDLKLTGSGISRLGPMMFEGRKEIGKAAFRPDARARALLRGVEHARADLHDAGGAYELEDVRTLLGVTRQAIGKRVAEGSLLALPGPSGRRNYPTVQFQADGSVVQGLKAVQEALPSRNAWFVLSFLVNPQDGLGGRKPIEAMKAGDSDMAVEAARRIGLQGA